MKEWDIFLLRVPFHFNSLEMCSFFLHFSPPLSLKMGKKNPSVQNVTTALINILLALLCTLTN